MELKQSKQYVKHYYEKRREYQRFRPKHNMFMTFQVSQTSIYMSGIITNISKSGIGFKSNICLPKIINLNDILKIKIQKKIYIVQVKHVSNNICGCKLLKK